MGEKIKSSPRKFSLEFKMNVVEEYLQGGTSKYGICKKYHLHEVVFRDWLRIFAPVPPSAASFMKKSKESESEEILELKRQLRQKELELKREKMRSAFLDTMIDVAEEMFNVPIRKKAGTKQ